jgi:hypothetical protein
VALLKAARRVMSAAHAPQFGTNEQMFGAKEQVPHAGGSDKEGENAMTAQPCLSGDEL